MFQYGDYLLREPVDEDAEGFYRISHDESVNRYYGGEGTHFKDMNDARRQVEWCRSQFQHNAGRFIIAAKAENGYIGDIGFSGYSETHHRAEIGYRLSREYWGKGIISHFIGQLVFWGFGTLGYNRIEALVDVRNEASKRVLIKNGFVWEGTLRQYEYEDDGYVDLAMYSILRDDYTKDALAGKGGS